jgi:hypothetical protein
MFVLIKLRTATQKACEIYRASDAQRIALHLLLRLSDKVEIRFADEYVSWLAFVPSRGH